MKTTNTLNINPASKAPFLVGFLRERYLQTLEIPPIKRKKEEELDWIAYRKRVDEVLFQK